MDAWGGGGGGLFCVRPRDALAEGGSVPASLQVDDDGDHTRSIRWGFHALFFRPPPPLGRLFHDQVARLTAEFWTTRNTFTHAVRWPQMTCGRGGWPGVSCQTTQAPAPFVSPTVLTVQRSKARQRTSTKRTWWMDRIGQRRKK